jgi:hypothetical protein
MAALVGCTQAGVEGRVAHIGYEGCKEVSLGSEPKALPGADESEAIENREGFSVTCHEEWTRVYGRFGWKAESKDEAFRWEPVVA